MLTYAPNPPSVTYSILFAITSERCRRLRGRRAISLISIRIGYDDGLQEKLSVLLTCQRAFRIRLVSFDRYR